MKSQDDVKTKIFKNQVSQMSHMGLGYPQSLILCILTSSGICSVGVGWGMVFHGSFQSTSGFYLLFCSLVLK